MVEIDRMGLAGVMDQAVSDVTCWIKSQSVTNAYCSQFIDKIVSHFDMREWSIDDLIRLNIGVSKFLNTENSDKLCTIFVGISESTELTTSFEVSNLKKHLIEFNHINPPKIYLHTLINIFTSTSLEKRIILYNNLDYFLMHRSYSEYQPSALGKCSERFNNTVIIGDSRLLHI